MMRTIGWVRALPLLVALVLISCASEADESAATPDPAAAEAAADPAPAGSPSADAASADLPATNYYAITTPKGRIVIRLYDETPAHRDNFKKLVAEAFYDSTRFHRVIAGFMIQGGDPNSMDDNPFDDGQGGPGYTLPAEILPAFFHKRGALAAARQGDQVNPDRRSSGSQFYLVHGGQPIPPEMLAEAETQLRQQIPDPSFSFAEEARAAYTTEGGAPWLDGMYTIFGEVVEGFDVLDAIAMVPTPNRMRQQAHPAVADRPAEDLWMVIRPVDPPVQP